MKSRTFYIPENIRPYLMDPSLEEVTFQYTDPIHALVSMLHFNPLAADWDNLCFTYEESDVYDDFCNGDRMKRIQATLPPGSAQLNAVMYFDGIHQDETGFVSVDGGIVLGAFFRKAAREQNEAMRSICSFVEVGCCAGDGVVVVFVHVSFARTFRKLFSKTQHRTHITLNVNAWLCF